MTEGTYGHAAVPAGLVVHAPTASAVVASRARTRGEPAERTREPVFVSTAARAATALLELTLFVLSAGLGWALWCATCVRSGRTPAMSLCGQQALDRRSGEPVTGLAAVYGPRSRIAVVHSRTR